MAQKVACDLDFTLASVPFRVILRYASRPFCISSFGNFSSFPIRGAGRQPALSPGPPNTTGADSTESKSTIVKLQSIIVPKVHFEKLDVAHVVQFLTAKSKELDPDHRGVSFLLDLPADTSTPRVRRPVSITLSAVPLTELLGYVCSQTNLQYKL